MNKLETKRALTIAEASRYACVSRGALEAWLIQGLLPFEELPGRGNGVHKFRRIRRTDIDEFLNQHYHQPRTKRKENSNKTNLILLPRKKDSVGRNKLESLSG